LKEKGDNVAVLDSLIIVTERYSHQKNLEQVKYEENKLFVVDSSGTVLLYDIIC